MLRLFHKTIESLIIKMNEIVAYKQESTNLKDGLDSVVLEHVTKNVPAIPTPDQLKNMRLEKLESKRKEFERKVVTNFHHVITETDSCGTIVVWEMQSGEYRAYYSKWFHNLIPNGYHAHVDKAPSGKSWLFKVSVEEYTG